MTDESTRRAGRFPRIPNEVLKHVANAGEELRKGVAALLPSLPP